MHYQGDRLPLEMGIPKTGQRAIVLSPRQPGRTAVASRDQPLLRSWVLKDGEFPCIVRTEGVRESPTEIMGWRN